MPEPMMPMRITSFLSSGPSNDVNKYPGLLAYTQAAGDYGIIDWRTPELNILPDLTDRCFIVFARSLAGKSDC